MTRVYTAVSSAYLSSFMPHRTHNRSPSFDFLHHTNTRTYLLIYSDARRRRYWQPNTKQPNEKQHKTRWTFLNSKPSTAMPLPKKLSIHLTF